MEFGKSLLTPSYHRKPDFRSENPVEKNFGFDCVNCEKSISFEFGSIIGKEWTWRNDFDPQVADEIARFYDMNIAGKSPDGGQPAVTTTRCGKCRTKYLICAGVNEAANSFYIVTLQGITEIIDSRNP